MKEFNQDGELIKTKEGREVTESVLYIALELATGGELFDYVAQTGKFSEPIARFYFK